MKDGLLKIPDDFWLVRESHDEERRRHQKHRAVCLRRRGRPIIHSGVIERNEKRRRSDKRSEKFLARDELKPIDEITLITYEPAGPECRKLVRSSGRLKPEPITDFDPELDPDEDFAYLSDTVTVRSLLAV